MVDALDSKSSSGNRVGVRFPPQVQGFEQRSRCRKKQRKPTSSSLEGGFSAFSALPQAVVETLRAMLRRQGKGEHAEGGAGHSPRVHSQVGALPQAVVEVVYSRKIPGPMKKVLAVMAAMVLLSGCGAKKPQGGLKNASYAGCEYLQDPGREFECFNNTLASYLADEYKYPEAARSLGVEGKIYVNFVVESDGSISNVKVVKGLDALLDAEAIRAVRALPTMIPATYDGRPVRIQYTIPINANLK